MKYWQKCQVGGDRKMECSKREHPCGSADRSLSKECEWCEWKDGDMGGSAK